MKLAFPREKSATNRSVGWGFEKAQTLDLTYWRHFTVLVSDFSPVHTGQRKMRQTQRSSACWRFHCLIASMTTTVIAREVPEIPKNIKNDCGCLGGWHLGNAGVFRMPFMSIEICCYRLPRATLDDQNKQD